METSTETLMLRNNDTLHVLGTAMQKSFCVCVLKLGCHQDVQLGDSAHTPHRGFPLVRLIVSFSCPLIHAIHTALIGTLPYGAAHLCITSLSHTHMLAYMHLYKLMSTHAHTFILMQMCRLTQTKKYDPLKWRPFVTQNSQ